MVVMDYVDGITVDRAPSLPSSFHEQVQAILTFLHQHDFVFGDIRGPNLMLTKDAKVVLIDCDWIGKHGVSQYPIMMSQSIKWPEGVKDGLGVMKKEHDLEMLGQLLPGRVFVH
jgi:RIO-like serine/threonine protein kinase